MLTFRSAITMTVLATAATLFAAGDVLTRLHVDPQHAAEYAVDALSSGNVPVWEAREALRAASPEARAALVEQALIWAKGYVSSSAFREEYAKKREEAKPAALEAHKTFEEEQRARQAETAEQMDQARKAIAALPADQRKEAEKAIEQGLAAQKQMASDPEMQKAARQMYDAQIADDQKHHDEEVARWQSDWPADSRTLLVKRLREFLTVSATVDFGAKLVSSGGRMQFANPEYQQESSDWKLCYRAGKPAVEKARAFAQGWLAELGAK